METRVTGVEKSVRRRLWLTAGLQSGVRLALAFLSFRWARSFPLTQL